MAAPLGWGRWEGNGGFPDAVRDEPPFSFRP